jgi:hypothetical protein
MLSIDTRTIEDLRRTEAAFLGGDFCLAYGIAVDFLKQHPLCVRLLIIAFRSGMILGTVGDDYLRYLEAAELVDPNNCEVRLARGRYLLATCED